MIKFFINIFFIFLIKRKKSNLFQLNQRMLNYLHLFLFYNESISIEKNHINSIFYNESEKFYNNRKSFCFHNDQKYENYILNKNKSNIGLFFHLYIGEYKIFFNNFYIINLNFLKGDNKNIYFFVKKENLIDFSKYFFCKYFIPVDNKKEILKKINSF